MPWRSIGTKVDWIAKKGENILPFNGRLPRGDASLTWPEQWYDRAAYESSLGFEPWT